MRIKNGLSLKVLQFSKCSCVVLLEPPHKPKGKIWKGRHQREKRRG